MQTAHQDVDLEELLKLGKSYKWNRPSCPNGCPKMWGHGFVRRWVEELSEFVFLHRYRCPTCSCVLTIALPDRWQRYESSTKTIFAVLSHRLSHGRWPRGSPRQRCGHWLRKFITKVRMDFPTSDDLCGLLRRLFDAGICYLS